MIYTGYIVQLGWWYEGNGNFLNRRKVSQTSCISYRRNNFCQELLTWNGFQTKPYSSDLYVVCRSLNLLQNTDSDGIHVASV